MAMMRKKDVDPGAVGAAAPARPGGRRLRTIARRVGGGLLTLLVISALIYGGTSAQSPRSIALAALGQGATTQQIDEWVHTHGLDQPVPKRYVQWLGKFVRGDWGNSVVTDHPVREAVAPRIPRTVILAVLAMLLAVPAGIALGVFSARRWGKRSDFAANMVSVVISALPEFVVGLALLIVFTSFLHWFPVDSTSAFTFGTAGEKAKAYVLPIVAVAILTVPLIARVTRAAVHEALSEPYTTAATLRGLPTWTVVRDCGLRNAALPILNAVGITMIYALGGVVVVETVFSFPGLGQQTVASIATSDATTVAADGLVLAAFFIGISTLVDVAAQVFNPRLRGHAR
jgi:peptide/nickel transport system permease protein